MNLNLLKKRKNFLKKKKKEETSTKDIPEKTKVYKSYKPFEKERLFYLVKEKDTSLRAAALFLQINPRTAQSWMKKDEEDLQDVIYKKEK